MFDPKEAFLIKNLLGEGAIEELAKAEIYKDATNTVVDPNEISVALKIVPRIVLNWLILMLGPLKPRDSRVFELDALSPKSNGCKLYINKTAADIYQGEIVKDGKRIARIVNRPLPAVGLVIMTTFELYDLDDLNKESKLPPTVSLEPNLEEVRAIIERRLKLQHTVEQIVDQKLFELQSIKNSIANAVAESNNLKDTETKESEPKFNIDDFRSHDTVTASKSKIKQILDKRKRPEIVIAKGESFSCPDCGAMIFSQGNFKPCICFGEDRNKKIFLAKTDNGYKVKFSNSWEPENIELILEALKAKNHPHEEE